MATAVVVVVVVVIVVVIDVAAAAAAVCAHACTRFAARAAVLFRAGVKSRAMLESQVKVPKPKGGFFVGVLCGPRHASPRPPTQTPQPLRPWVARGQWASTTTNSTTNSTTNHSNNTNDTTNTNTNTKPTKDISNHTRSRSTLSTGSTPTPTRTRT